MFPPRQQFDWQIGDGALRLGDRTLVMGVLNVTPDSFSDGGRNLNPPSAIAYGLRLLDEGADIVDIGGESTRPGSETVGEGEERRRILPVIEGILRARPNALLSVDTWRSPVAAAAITAGARIVNDVSGFTWDPHMPLLCAQLACGVVAMHTRGRPSQWKDLPPLEREQVLPLVRSDLEATAARAQEAGIAASALVLDPGFGFGKKYAGDCTLLAQFDQLKALGFPLLAGVSRKGFLGRELASLYGGVEASVHQREIATIAALTASILGGAHIVRVHSVRPAVEAALIADAILRG